jgi:pimeloyl-ACP methyl ester carboxylesterase
MTETREGTLPVAGATLYYRVRGSGPPLLILPGGDGDADASNAIADLLVDAYRVVTYDRRGLSRSALDTPADAPRALETHSDDAHRLLAALTSEPAIVVGFSIGALIGLDLVARYPEQVRVLVAHEPPAKELLPGPQAQDAERRQLEVEGTFRRDGVIAAMRQFAALSGMNLEDREPDLELPRPSPQRGINLAFFLTHDAPAVRRYRVDLQALSKATATTHIVPAAGSTSRDIWTHRCAAALAERLGEDLVEFPGGHNGFVTHPRAFAARLREVLAVSSNRDMIAP